MIADTSTHRIWIAGRQTDAVRAVQQWCRDRGDCYAVLPCDYIYSGGLEAGVCVTRINYPRFAEAAQDIFERCKGLGDFLARELCQKSYSIETPTTTYYIKVSGVWGE